MPNEKGEALVEYALTFVLVAIVVVAVLLFLDSLDGHLEFDQGIDAQTIVVTGNHFPARDGSINHPLAIPSVYVPWGGRSYYLQNYPRAWDLNGCIEVFLKPEMNTLYAATTTIPEVAEKINIQTPIPGGKTVTVCGPPQTTVRIFLWGK